MKKHLIVDFSFLYYKYKFQMLAGKLPKLSTVTAEYGEVDTSIPYYSMREVEKFRREFESDGSDVTVSICFDSPSVRKDIDDTDVSVEYKSNRHKVLDESDFNSMILIADTFKRAGYNVFKFRGFEADDIVTSLVRETKEKYDKILIYTPDADLLVNVYHNVEVMRYKSGKGYARVTMQNFEDYLLKEFKCYVPYNAITLFKCTVGDKSDCIKGINRFGPAAFEKLIAFLSKQKVDFTGAEDADRTAELLDLASEFLGEDKKKQAFEALGLVRPLKVNIPDSWSVSSPEKRKEAYGSLGMTSLTE